jgi:hypothetical protein
LFDAWQDCQLPDLGITALARGEVPVMLSLRLFLPESWTLDGSEARPGSVYRERKFDVGEHRASGEKKYYLANLPEKTRLHTLAETINGRWICEQAHQQLKEELGLDHFEGRSWQGLHRHALMTMIA